jgi:hypothetical protein
MTNSKNFTNIGIDSPFGMLLVDQSEFEDKQLKFWDNREQKQFLKKL